MTKILGMKTKKRGRPRKVVQEKIKLEKIPDEIVTWEDEGGFVPPIVEDYPPQINITPQRLFRKSQWDMLDDYSKSRLNMTEEEFLTKEDVTGFGPNSYFTPRSER